MSIAEYDDIVGIIHELLPSDSNFPNDFYQSRKLLQGLGMPYVKIDVCYNNCIFFYKDDARRRYVMFVVPTGMRKATEQRFHAKF
jgi:hypothetical protein